MTLVVLDPRLTGSADLLASLHKQVFADFWPATAFAALLSIPGTVALVVAAGDAPCGFVLARIVADEAEIITLGVLPARRRQGMARALLAAACGEAHAAGARSLFLEVAARNAAARGLYAEQGFREVGRRRGYYAAADADDALVLRRDLGSGLGAAPDGDDMDA